VPNALMARIELIATRCSCRFFLQGVPNFGMTALDYRAVPASTLRSKAINPANQVP